MEKAGQETGAVRTKQGRTSICSPSQYFRLDRFTVWQNHWKVAESYIHCGPSMMLPRDLYSFYGGISSDIPISSFWGGLFKWKWDKGKISVTSVDGPKYGPSMIPRERPLGKTPEGGLEGSERSFQVKDAFEQSYIPYARAIITRSWLETALEY